MERRIRPWINKKIIEYIGEEEATLVDFVCSKVSFFLSLSPIFILYFKSLHPISDPHTMCFHFRGSKRTELLAAAGFAISLPLRMPCYPLLVLMVIMLLTYSSGGFVETANILSLKFLCQPSILWKRNKIVFFKV